ncbi:MAG: hypothetical protein CMK32_07400 [Porticoccaceae bacterium]|nr:hypothetical protein [Porticoccaceae bacterium]
MEKNKEIVRQLLSDISQWNIDEALAALDDRCQWWVAGHLPGLSGNFSKIEMGETFRAMASTLVPSGLNITVDHMIAEGDFVAVEGHSDAMLPNGLSYQNQYHWKFQLRGGKVVSAKEYLDTQLVAEISGGQPQ